MQLCCREETLYFHHESGTGPGASVPVALIPAGGGKKRGKYDYVVEVRRLSSWDYCALRTHDDESHTYWFVSKQDRLSSLSRWVFYAQAIPTLM